MTKIPLHAPIFDSSERKALLDCINSGWVTNGRYINLFEDLIRKYTKSKYVLATSSGTSALHISLICAGVKKNDEVLVPTITFVATINVVLYVNAQPVFFDSDQYLNLDLENLQKFFVEETYYKDGFTYNKKTKKRIKAIIATHIFGNCINIQKLKKICFKKNIKIIEDAAESLGSFISIDKKLKHIGTTSLAGCLSFNGNKIITSGGGGAIMTNNYNLYKLGKYLINQAKENGTEFIHNEIGFNYRISNLHSSVGYCQLKKIDSILKKKRKIHQIYSSLIDKIDGLRILQNPPFSKSNNWLNILVIEDNKKYKKSIIMKNLLKHGIDTRPMWKLNHLQKPFLKFQSYNIKNAYVHFKNTICLPSSHNLKKENIQKIIEIIKN